MDLRGRAMAALAALASSDTGTPRARPWRRRPAAPADGGVVGRGRGRARRGGGTPGRLRLLDEGTMMMTMMMRSCLSGGLPVAVMLCLNAGYGVAQLSMSFVAATASLQLCKLKQIDLNFRKSRPKLTLEIFAYIFVTAALGDQLTISIVGATKKAEKDEIMKVGMKFFF